MQSVIIFIFLASSANWIGSSECEQLGTIAQWQLLDFALPYDPSYLNKYRPENVVPTGIEAADHRIFIATPRLRAGVPATLSTIPRNLPSINNPRLEPYPSWEWHSVGRDDFNCSGLISVYRTRVDHCNRLWVLDSGINTSIDDFRVVCPPKLLVFDLESDQLIRRVIFPREVLRPNSLLTNLVIDETLSTTCDDVFVYMTDTTGPGLLIFDGATDRSWRLLHKSMFPDPNYATYQIGSDTFELFDGIVGLTFSPKKKLVYYQPLATDRMYSVHTSALQSGPLPFGSQLPVTLIGRKSSQGLGLAVDYRDDTILFAPFTETAVASWNPDTNDQRIISFSPEALQFVAELRWLPQENGKIWILSSRFQKFFNRQINPRDINIRILEIRPDTFVLAHSSIISPYDRHFSLQHLYNNTLNH
ncbi:hypothetical protein PV327_001978 [Microctonus hyperodae]|uniref:Bee-milk protein n=1 Tax=Microctonus hyperodae TaxID=165561 RepID=A0AA39FEL3_MICHY|nr:hypothetical protein PV327_001978 [Microctonus hyperodae]